MGQRRGGSVSGDVLPKLGARRLGPESHGRRISLDHLGSNEGTLLTPSRISNPLKTDWQRHVLASSGYLELGMFDDAALVLEEIAPEDKNRNEVARRTC